MGSVDRCMPTDANLGPALTVCLRIIREQLFASDDERQYLDPEVAAQALEAVTLELQASYRPVWRADDSKSGA